MVVPSTTMTNESGVSVRFNLIQTCADPVKHTMQLRDVRLGQPLRHFRLDRAGARDDRFVDLPALLAERQLDQALVSVVRLALDQAAFSRLATARLTLALSMAVRSQISFEDKGAKAPSTAIARHSGIEMPNSCS